MRTADDLRQKQALPLSLKIALTKDRIRQWVNEYGEDGVYVSYSGGKDSTVLLHIVRSMYPEVKAVFCDTGLEYPSVRQMVKNTENVDYLKPKMTFKEVIIKYGYPIIGKEVAAAIHDAKNYIRKLTEYRQTDRQTDRCNTTVCGSDGGPLRNTEKTDSKNEPGISRLEEGNYP